MCFIIIYYVRCRDNRWEFYEKMFFFLNFPISINVYTHVQWIEYNKQYCTENAFIRFLNRYRELLSVDNRSCSVNGSGVRFHEIDLKCSGESRINIYVYCPSELHRNRQVGYFFPIPFGVDIVYHNATRCNI